MTQWLQSVSERWSVLEAVTVEVAAEVRGTNSNNIADNHNHQHTWSLDQYGTKKISELKAMMLEPLTGIE